MMQKTELESPKAMDEPEVWGRPDTPVSLEPPPPSGEPRSFLESAGAKLLLLGAAVVLILSGLLVWRHYMNWESTDDATIDGDIYQISPRITGHVVRVEVENNQYVEAGTVLVRLDPMDHQVALERAQAQYADATASAQAAQASVPITSVNTTSQTTTAGASVETAIAGVATAQKNYQSEQARVEEAAAQNAKAQSDLQRYSQLVSKLEISEQQYDQAVAAAKSAAATLAAVEASATAAQNRVTEAQGRLAQARSELRATRSGPQQVAATRARADAAEAAVKTAKANLDQAELNLRYTTITAPVSGVVGKKSVEPGQNVQPGQALMAIVPLNGLYVTANFKETQLQRMRPGQEVKVHVDAYNRDYTGRVLNLAGATGEQFSLLPPENATGNYVKVVQRVPVKIVFDPGQDKDHLLRLGMSVEPDVHVGK